MRSPLRPAVGLSALERSRRRSLVVRRLRRGAPWAMGLVALIVASWIGGRAVISALHPAETGQEVRMSRPHFIGRDDHGKPYSISASQAVRDARDDAIIHLVDPDMLLDTGAPARARLRGRVGVFNEKTRVLDVAEHVIFEDGAGYIFHSEKTRIDTGTLEVQGDAPVQGEGPIGRIAALSYAIHDRGAHVVFTGNVRSHINNDRSQEPPRP